MYRPACLLTILLVLLGTAAEPVLAQESETKTLRVGTKVVPPFVMQDEEGEWTGISVDLWRELASDLGLKFRFEKRSLPDLFAGLEDGSLDAAIAALTVTAERERSVDFTHPYFQSSLGIAVAPRESGGWLSVLRRILSRDFLNVLGILLILLVGSGLLVWAFERRKNQEQFGGGVAKGIGSGFWWSAVTMTTVGYGDKSPRSIGGRIVGLVWMFACVVFLSGLTATIASALTVSRLESAVNGPADLAHVRVATVTGTTSESYLRGRRMAYRAFPTLDAALEALAAGRMDAVVYDRPLLRWRVNREHAGNLAVLPVSFRYESYAIALPPDSAYKEALNRLIPDLTSGDRWADTLQRHLGP